MDGGKPLQRVQAPEPQHRPLALPEGLVDVLGSIALPARTVLCANDRVVFGTLAASHAAGLRVGREASCNLRVAGHDDHPLSHFACPGLTIMAQSYDGMANKAVRMLMDAMDGSGEPAYDAEVPPTVRLPAVLVTRGSA